MEQGENKLGLFMDGPLGTSGGTLLKPCKGFLHNTKDVLRIAKGFEHT